MKKEFLLSSPMEHFDLYSIANLSWEINNLTIYQFIAFLVPILIGNLFSFVNKLSGTKWTVMNESMYRTVLLMLENYTGKNNLVYFPLIYTIFYLVLFANLIGLIPYSSTPTMEFVLSLSVAITLLIGIQIIGIINHGKYIFSAFLPAGTPIFLIGQMIPLEIISYISRTLALGLRLSVNMTTGHTLVKVCSGFIWVAYAKGTSFLILIVPLMLLTVFQALELLIAYLQAYIFTFITCITIKDMS